MNAFLFTGNQLLILLESQSLTLPPPTAIFYLFFIFLFFLPHWLGFINRKKVFLICHPFNSCAPLNMDVLQCQCISQHDVVSH